MTLHNASRRWLVPFCLALLLGSLALVLPAPAVSAATLHVTSCTDRGTVGTCATRSRR